MEPAEAVLQLVKACPSFAAEWAEYLASEYPADGQAERLPHVDIGELARHVVARARIGSTSELPGLFALVEGLYDRCGSELQNILTVGLLEGIQNNSLAQGLDLSEFEPWLGNKTRAEWDYVVAFWQGGTPGGAG